MPERMIPEQICGGFAASFIAGGPYYACVLPKGHTGEHRGGGQCFIHGKYVMEHSGQIPCCPECEIAVLKPIWPGGVTMRKGWYIYCPNCGAEAFLSRWLWVAKWKYWCYGITSFPGCGDAPGLVWYEEILWRHDGQDTQGE
jgi:hypothetical protein